MNWRHSISWDRVVSILIGLCIGLSLGSIIFPRDNSIKKNHWTSVVTIGTEVLMNVFDDGRSTVYIKANDKRSFEEDFQLADILDKKRAWEMKFPTKKVTAMSIVTGDNGSNGQSYTAGLLIHYEQHQ